MLHARGQSTAVLQQQHVDRLQRHTIHTTSAAHGNGPKRDTISLPALLLFRSYNEVFVQTAFIPCYLSTDIDFVCVLCTSSSSAAVASLSLPLSICVFLCCPRQRSQARCHFSTCPFTFSQLQRSVCTNGIYSLLPQHRYRFRMCTMYQ